MTEATAQQVMEGGEQGIQRLAETEVHVQRMAAWGDHPLTERDDDGGDDGISLRRVLQAAVGGAIPAAAVNALVKSGAIEAGLADPQTALLTGVASVATAGTLAGKIDLYKQIDPQVLRHAFAAAGKEALLDDLLRSLGADVDTDEGDDPYDGKN